MQAHVVIVRGVLSGSAAAEHLKLQLRADYLASYIKFFFFMS